MLRKKYKKALAGTFLKNVRANEGREKKWEVRQDVGLHRVLHEISHSIASLHVNNKVECRSSLPSSILSNDASSYTKLRHVDEGLKVVFIHKLITMPNPFRRVQSLTEELQRRAT